MKRHLLRAILFVACFTGVYYATYFILFRVQLKGQPLVKSVQKELILDKDIFGKVYSEFDKTKKYDLVFLGSSHCYRDFNPAVFEKAGYACYNLGSSSQAPVNSFSVLQNVIDNTMQVIFEVYPVAGNLGGTESYYSMACSGLPYSLLAPMAVDLNNLRCYNILSIKPFIDHYNHNVPYNIPNHYKGYVETKDSTSVGIIYEELLLKKGIMDEQLEYVRKIAELCAQKKVELFFVYAPVPKELKLINENYYLEKIREIASRNHIQFIDSGRGHALNSKNHFYDDDHLNSSGVELFNRSVIEILKGKQKLN